MKASSATSARTTRAPVSGQPSASANASRPSPGADGGYPLAGVSDPPDPDFHAYRQDLADVALAGRVIASHYAEPLPRQLVAGVALHRAAAADSEEVADLAAGDVFYLLDSTGGWSWGYGGPDRRVGYVRSDALAA